MWRMKEVIRHTWVYLSLQNTYRNKTWIHMKVKCRFQYIISIKQSLKSLKSYPQTINTYLDIMNNIGSDHKIPQLWSSSMLRVDNSSSETPYTASLRITHSVYLSLQGWERSGVGHWCEGAIPAKIWVCTDLTAEPCQRNQNTNLSLDRLIIPEINCRNDCKNRTLNNQELEERVERRLQGSIDMCVFMSIAKTTAKIEHTASNFGGVACVCVDWWKKPYHIRVGGAFIEPSENKCFRLSIKHSHT